MWAGGVNPGTSDGFARQGLAPAGRALSVSTRRLPIAPQSLAYARALELSYTPRFAIADPPPCPGGPMTRTPKRKHPLEPARRPLRRHPHRRRTARIGGGRRTPARPDRLHARAAPPAAAGPLVGAAQRDFIAGVPAPPIGCSTSNPTKWRKWRDTQIFYFACGPRLWTAVTGVNHSPPGEGGGRSGSLRGPSAGSRQLCALPPDCSRNRSPALGKFPSCSTRTNRIQPFLHRRGSTAAH
jgi:hypothetical protein